METENPIALSIDYLVDCGWTKEQAKNLCSAIYSDTGEKLWDFAPRWIEHCGQCKKYVDGMLGTVATGLVKVTETDGEWFFSLNEKGLKVGEEMFTKEKE